MTSEEFGEKYTRLAHAVQTGIAQMMGADGADCKETQPKHLRVGINMSMCEHAALAKLLIEKKIITENEYYSAIIAELEREVRRYEQTLCKRYGVPITLM